MKDDMLTTEFWKQALQRAIRTFAQSSIAVIGVGTTNLFTADVKNILAIATSSAILSLLMSIDRTSETPAVSTVVEIPPIVEIDLPHTNMRG